MANADALASAAATGGVALISAAVFFWLTVEAMTTP